ncbi:O-antigen ligase domain-containing protein [Lacrimispora amygdalina]|uniref:O-antigen ligase domain-containing protein n=1 Tax=Lacrimispora amygdalina TaxID=253257 RepID=A0A3E2N4S2_9FIRM|nr:O-antigen ligase family protein [Clostridium indicum]RFZ75972.1 O-antigen ligase domain-containing protein [Clostridium indicum]
MKIISEKTRFLTWIVAIYVLAIGIGTPLIIRNAYFDILVVKYYYYCLCTISLTILIVLYGLTSGKKSVNLYLSDGNLKERLKKLSVADISLLVFYFNAVLSTFTSSYLYESFWGNEGRYTGLFLITLYVLSYFFISRFWVFKAYFIDLMLGIGILVCLFGITDYFKLDIFRFKVLMLEEQRAIFTSTIGNINTYTAYVGIIVAISAVLYATSKEKRRIAVYYICLIISFIAIVTGTSDNAYLSLLALFVFLPFYLFENRLGVRKYITILATFLSVIQGIDWVNKAFPDKVLGVDGVFNVVIMSGLLMYLIAGLWIIVFLLVYIKNKNSEIKYNYKFRSIWLLFVCIGILIVLFILYDCNSAGHAERYGGLSNYFQLNDNWGTHRGFIWRKSIERYKELPIWKKVVGYGPETFGILMLDRFKNNPYNEIFDSAHNEYLHILMTMGILGLVSYLVFVFGVIKDCCSRNSKNPYIIAIAFGVICYAVQAFVNLNLPIVTPIFWLLAGMGASRLLTTDNKSQ